MKYKKRIVKKRFKKINEHDSVTILNKLTAEQHTFLKSLVHDDHNTGKLLPKSRTFVEKQSPVVIGRKILIQKGAHDNPHLDYHYGGGIHETFNGIMNTVHNINPVTQISQSITDTVQGVQTNNNKLTNFEVDMAELVQEAYKTVEDRDHQINNNWVLVPELSNDFCATYEDARGKYYLGVRGTRDLNDLKADYEILTTNETQNKMVDEIVTALSDKGSKINIAAHSLGSALVRSALVDENKDNFDTYFFNPGSTTTVGTDKLKTFISDWKPHIFLNGGDIISQGYNQALPPDYKNIKYGTPGLNPLSNHSLNQWIN